MEKRELVILKYLEKYEFATAQMLSDELQISVKTVRNRIKEINEILKKCNAQIESRAGVGYHLVVTDPKAYRGLKAEKASEKDHETIDGRMSYLLKLLLTRRDYIKLDDLSEIMYISTKALSNNLKEVEKVLYQYNLVLERRPNYGIRICGEEFDIRRCLANQTIDIADIDIISEAVDSEVTVRAILTIVFRVLAQNTFKMSDPAIRNLAVHIFVAVERVRSGNYIPFNAEVEKHFVNTKEYDVSKSIIEEISQMYHVTFPSSEIEYIAIHLAGKKVIMDEIALNNNDNIVIQQDVLNLAKKMIQRVYEAFQLDFRSDLELLMSLSQHIIPLVERVTYDIPAKNQLLRDIKKSYSFAYVIASHAATVITERYGKMLVDDEIGFIALTFALALERKRTESAKKNILVICSNEKGVAKLLIYQCKQEFGQYINQIKRADAYGLADYDFSDVDYVFTTVPITVNIPVPILNIKHFWDSEDIESIKEKLEVSNAESVLRYYDERLFLSNVKAKTREEALRVMCDHIATVKEIPASFYDFILKREKLAKTEFGNNVAMPHPYQAVTSDTFVCVGILENPVFWAEKTVEVIFLVSVSNKKNKNLSKFYKVTANLMLNAKYIHELVQNRDFSTLEKIISKIEKGQD